MIAFDDLIASITFLIPGYIAFMVMNHFIGGKRRDASQVVIYSVVFSVFIYLLLWKINPVTRSYGLDFLNIQPALNRLSASSSDADISLSEAVKVAFVAIAVGFLLGEIIGVLRTKKVFIEGLKKYTNRTQHLSPMHDYFAAARNDLQSVYLKNGNAFHGQIVFWPDAGTEADKGVVLSHPKYELQPFVAYQNGEKAKSVVLRGMVFVPQEEIAFIRDVEDERLREALEKMSNETAQTDSQTFWERLFYR